MWSSTVPLDNAVFTSSCTTPDVKSSTVPTNNAWYDAITKCMCLDIVSFLMSIFLSDPPNFTTGASSVNQDPVSVTVNGEPEPDSTGSTVISWRPVAVASGVVTYTVRLNGEVVADNLIATSTRLTGLLFNTEYSVTIEAFNSCNEAGTPLQDTIEIRQSGSGGFTFRRHWVSSILDARLNRVCQPWIAMHWVHVASWSVVHMKHSYWGHGTLCTWYTSSYSYSCELYS